MPVKPIPTLVWAAYRKLLVAGAQEILPVGIARIGRHLPLAEGALSGGLLGKVVVEETRDKSGSIRRSLPRRPRFRRSISGCGGKLSRAARWQRDQPVADSAPNLGMHDLDGPASIHDHDFLGPAAGLGEKTCPQPLAKRIPLEFHAVERTMQSRSRACGSMSRTIVRFGSSPPVAVRPMFQSSSTSSPPACP